MKSLITFLILLVALNAGAQSYWDSVSSGTNKRLLSVSFGSSTVGYIGGNDSLLLKTTDGGHTWLPISPAGLSFSLASQDIVHLNFINQNVGYAIVSNYDYPEFQGQLHKTTDGGLTWSVVNSGTIAGRSTFFFDEQNGYQVGSAFFIGHTLIELQNGIWQPEHFLMFGSQEFLYTIDCYNSNMCITGGSGGYVYRTFNGGTTWDTVKTVVDSTIRSVKFVNDSTIIAATYNSGGAMIYSTDTGATWDIDMSSLTFFYPQMNDMVLSPKDSLIAVGNISFNPEQGIIQSWHDGWPQVQWTDHVMYGVAMRDDSVAFAVGDSGLIMSNMHTIVGVTTPIAEQEVLVVYPNPSTGLFTTVMSQVHTLAVFDLAGRVVLNNNNFSEQHVIDLSNNAKGIYLIRGLKENGEAVYKKVLVQ